MSQSWSQHTFLVWRVCGLTMAVYSWGTVEPDLRVSIPNTVWGTLCYLTTFRDCLSSLFWLEKVRRLKDRGEKFVLSIDLSVFLQSTYASAYHI
jgi:hypothetical protein